MFKPRCNLQESYKESQYQDKSRKHSDLNIDHLIINDDNNMAYQSEEN